MKAADAFVNVAEAGAHRRQVPWREGRRSKRGEFGVVFQAASEAGDYWAEKGVAGGLKEFGKEAWRAFKSLF